MDELNDVIYIKKDEISKSLNRYRKLMSILENDLPIACLCLPKVIENKLINMGCLRIYDVIDLDLTKIKGLGKSRLALLNSRLDQFISV